MTQLFDELKVFIKVYEQRNFTKAAELLFISQPTLSTKIKQLERQLATTFFIRKGPKSLVPTDAAHTFYQYALRTLDEYEHTLAQMHGTKRIRCHIGCSNTIAVHYFPKIFPQLVAKFPHIDFMLSLANSAKVTEGVAQHQLDIGLIEKPLDTHPLQKINLCNDELVLAGDLASPYWLMREKQSGVHFFNELYISEQNIHAHLIDTNSNEIITALLQQGFGKTILSHVSLPQGIPFKRLSTRYHRQLFLINRADQDDINDVTAEISTLFQQ
ncbi:LysR family transcriptional regulator [Kurthia huakuii]|uniref:LysR family transcriptional regulator n=1 Tax=Kurthia huakuii TaxID=1421019 RepID=UPI003B8A8949